MNSIIINEDGTITDQKVLTHLKEVLRSKVGDDLRCTILENGIFKGKISELSDEFCKIEISRELPSKLPWIDFIVGASRPPTLKKILEHGTTMGVNSFQIFKAELSEKSYLSSQIFEPSQMDEILMAGISQSGTYFSRPIVDVYENNPSEGFKDSHQNFILDFHTNQTFSDISIDFSQPISIAIGPERGFTDLDRERFEKNNFQMVRVSSTILRVEHAAFYALAQLELLKMKTKR